jgi:hypothetical protein
MTTLKGLIDNTKELKNDYNVSDTPDKSFKASSEAPRDFLNRCFSDAYMDRPAYLDEEGYIMLSIFGRDGDVDNVHDVKHDSYYKLYIKVVD